MSWSLNEVEGLARKAARGAGMSWGLAEEAGKATRWLVSHNLPGAEILAQLLTQNDGTDYAALCPVTTTGLWHAPQGPLCPLIAGATICDHAAHLTDEEGFALGPTSYPMMLLPFAAGLAQLSGTSVAVSWPGSAAVLTQEGNMSLTEDITLMADHATIVQIAATASPIVPASPCVWRADIPADVAETLGALAHRTYAPDTPESRLAGAGAGLTDND